MVAAASRVAGQRWVIALVLTAVAGTLGGCVEQMPEAQVGRGDIRNAIARGQMTSPKAATVALVSFEGAPSTVEGQFRQSFAGEAASREIAITDIASARYLVRGYLAAYPAEQGGVEVSYTYDIFDAGNKRREQRVADTMDVPGDAADPWTAVNAAVLSSIAARSADDLAVSLAGTPEAQAAAGKVAAASPGAAPTATPN